jgi:hypothetical protein
MTDPDVKFTLDYMFDYDRGSTFADIELSNAFLGEADRHGWEWNRSGHLSIKRRIGLEEYCCYFFPKGDVYCISRVAFLIGDSLMFIRGPYSLFRWSFLNDSLAMFSGLKESCGWFRLEIPTHISVSDIYGIVDDTLSFDSMGYWEAAMRSERYCWKNPQFKVSI